MLDRSWQPLRQLGALFRLSEVHDHQLPLLDSQSDATEEGIYDEIKIIQSHPRWLQRSFQPSIFSSFRPHMLWCTLPWFLSAALGKTQRKLPKKSSTSYLNGVRGIACLLVYNIHLNDHYYSNFHNPFGAEPAADNHGLSQLPVVRIIYAGKGMVCIFFVLSGFVLTYSPLRKMGNPSPSSSSDLLTGLCSSLLRRGVRLYAPMIVLICLTCLVTWNYPSFHPGHWRDGNQTFLEYAWAYVQIAKPLFNPFTWEGYLPQSFNQCWTLAFEFRGSLVVFLMCVATARLTTRARKTVVAFSAWSALYWMRWDVFCFLAGMVLAELRYNPLSNDFPFVKRWKLPRAVVPTLASCLLVLSMLVIGWPERGVKGVEPFNTIEKLTPTGYLGSLQLEAFYWGSIGGVGLMIAVENLPWIQWLLSTFPILYFGEISFSFYLLHWMFYLWPGAEMMGLFTQRLGWSGDVSFYAMFSLTLCLLVVASDYYWRAVDESCVKLGKLLVDWLGVHDNRNGPVLSVVEVESREPKEEELPRWH